MNIQARCSKNTSSTDAVGEKFAGGSSNRSEPHYEQPKPPVPNMLQVATLVAHKTMRAAAAPPQLTVHVTEIQNTSTDIPWCVPTQASNGACHNVNQVAW